MKIISLFLLAALCFFVIRVDQAGADAVETAGDAGAFAIPAAAAIMSLIHDDRDGTVRFLKAYASSTAVAYGLKYTVTERRPDGGEHAFPSWHAASAFAGAGFLQQRYGWKYGIPAYVASSLVGLSRIESKRHRLHDVIAGAVIGVGANLIFVKPFKPVTLAPVVGNGFMGVMVGKSF